MTRRLWAYLALIAAETRRAYDGRRRASPGEPATTSKWLTIRERAEEACRPRNGTTQVDGSVSPRPRRD